MTSLRRGRLATSNNMPTMKNTDALTDAIVAENYFPSGKLESRGTQVDGKLTGVFRRWYESGAIFGESEYIDGQLNGIIREWSEDGLLILSAAVKDGEFHGPYKSWWDSGLLKEEGMFQAGKRIGRYTWYKVDGSVWRSSDITRQ